MGELRIRNFGRRVQPTSARGFPSQQCCPNHQNEVSVSSTSPYPLVGAAGMGEVEEKAATRPFAMTGTGKNWSTCNVVTWDPFTGAATGMVRAMQDVVAPTHVSRTKRYVSIKCCRFALVETPEI